MVAGSVPKTEVEVVVAEGMAVDVAEVMATGEAASATSAMDMDILLGKKNRF